MSEGGTHPIPRVFISYAQYDPAHVARVLELAYTLEADGLAVELDQFHGQELIDWPRWCAERLDPKNTDFVLMVCSAEYRRRIEGRVELDVGRGVFWEGDLIYGYLYRAKANERFVPVLLDDESENAVPPAVANWNTFRLRRFGIDTGDQGYDDLYRLLTGQPATLRPIRGTVKALPPRAEYLEGIRPPLLMAAPPPEDFVARPLAFNALRAALRAAPSDLDQGRAVSITVAIKGAGGYGKTTLAQALCQDGVVQEAFPDGVLWITLGEQPRDLTGKLVDLVETLEGRRPGFTGLEAASAYLDQQLSARAILIVIDDVWNAAHARPFLVGGSRCAHLITTRDAATVPKDAHRVPVDEMTQLEAVSLLGWHIVGAEPKALARLAERLGKWPLLLKLVNAQLRESVDLGQSAEAAIDYVNFALDDGGLVAFDASDPESRDQAVAATLNASLKTLLEHERERFTELAVFPNDADVPLLTVARLWDATAEMKEVQTQKLVRRLFALSLLRDLDLRTQRLRIHEVVRGYLGQQLEQLSNDAMRVLHDQFLESWGLGHWSELAPDEPYLWRYLTYHLAGAGREHEARELLLHYDWLRAKLRATDVAALIADCAAFPDDRAVELLKGAIELSIPVLDEDADQLSSQLLGRLWNTDEPALESLSQQIVGAADRPWLRPHTKSLAQSGGFLRRRLLNTGYVTALAVIADGRRIVTIGGDVNNATLTTWDLDCSIKQRTLSWRNWPASGFVRSIVVSADGKRAVACAQSVSRAGMATEYRLALLDLENYTFVGTLKGHTGSVNVVAITADGRRAVSGGTDLTLRVWDLETSTCLHVLKGHSRGILAIEITQDQRRLVSVSHDNTIRVWDLRDGTLTRTLGGRGDCPISSVAVTTDGTLAICGITIPNAGFPLGPYLRIWNINSGQLVHVLQAHERPVTTVAVDDSSERTFSGSEDGTVKVWDLKTGSLLMTLSGHEGPVIAIGVSSDGHRAMTVSKDNTCKIWDLETSRVLNSYSDPMWSPTLTLHPLGWATELPAFTVCMTRRGPVLISRSDDGSCRVWNVPESGEKGRDAHRGSVTTVAVTVDARYVVSTADDGSLWIWDVTSGAPIAPSSECVSLMDLAPCSLRVVEVFGEQPRPSELEHVHPMNPVQLPPELNDRLAGLASGRQHLCTRYDGTLFIWDSLEDRRILNLRGHQGRVLAAAVSLENGGRLATVSRDETIKVWDASTGACIATFKGDSQLTCVAAAGRLFAAGATNGAVHVVELVV